MSASVGETTQINMIDHDDTGEQFDVESDSTNPSVDNDANQETAAQQSTYNSLIAMGFEESDCRSTAEEFGANLQGAINHIFQGGT